MKIAVTRIGALFHYAIPRTVHKLGKLDRFYTDLWSGKAWGGIIRRIPARSRPDALKRLAGRCADGLPSKLVTDFPLLALRCRFEHQRSRGVADELQGHIKAGRLFCEAILQKGLGGADTVYTTNTQGLELLTFARNRGLNTISEQTIAPFGIERGLMAEEQDRFPGWEEPAEMAKDAVEAYANREKQEWAQCDHIFCGSEFVKNSIREAGGPAGRCVVVPYGFEELSSKPVERMDRPGPLRVLTMGTVCLRKGVQYVAQVAEMLRGQMLFRVVGPSRLRGSGLQRLSSVVELVGAVPRSEVKAHFEWADVFLFPSLCEGSATVCFEALAAGLPVICTPNTGSVVRDGQEGFIIGVRDVPTAVDRLRWLDSDRHLLRRMSQAASVRRDYFSMDAYAARLEQALAAVSSGKRWEGDQRQSSNSNANP